MNNKSNKRITRKATTLLFSATLALSALFGVSLAHAGADKTTHPVVMVHGLAGFDDILGYHYFSDTYGRKLYRNCNWYSSCNKYLDDGQIGAAASMTPFQSSDKRGLELANAVESWMIANDFEHVNLVGHSQGGMDLRKAAKVLHDRFGYRVVKVAYSISSPHRGSPIAKHVLDLGDGVNNIVDALAEAYGEIVYGDGNDAGAALKQLVYDDYDPNDGVHTGAKQFNENYPVSSQYAKRYASTLNAQQGAYVNPALWITQDDYFNIDGDGYCTDDCSGDGAAGQGDGEQYDTDDDGLVGINSQQMGWRTQLHDNYWSMDHLTTITDTDNVDDLNYPTPTQMTSHAGVINQDHVDMIGIPSTTFDIRNFYGAIFDYIAQHDG
ncbi:hypothetical protein DES49_1863 [Halospina denitrificans]|uniref:Triacylglycerol lipase n=1 Tax=Halospina denitrificans TaxID=332522 RepID=A0A4R7JTV2_9GAMM|nr:acetyltransferase [Halospina denitrificans]TDT41761.1 hypothetical protein DES49_1863 [Halospina denitrificans]